MLKRLSVAAVLVALSTAAHASTFTTITNFTKNMDNVDNPGALNAPVGLSTGNQGTGIEFDIVNDINGNDVWHSDPGGAGTKTLTINVNQFGVTTVHTLMNTWWGTTATGLASIEFSGTNGASVLYDIVGGTHVRDLLNGFYTNTITSPDSQVWWSNGLTGLDQRRIDVQSWDLGAAFANETLQTITLTDMGAAELQRVYLAGLTLETDAAPVPLPAAGWMLLAALGGLAYAKRRAA
ncbi:MAG: VPLPA-CTERM sorting domain-containing protein [Pseudomonadota bacterium]